MNILAKAACAAAVALALCACSTSIVVPNQDSGDITLSDTTHSSQIPGFMPTWGEKTANSLFVWPDMDKQSDFVSDVCNAKGQSSDARGISTDNADTALTTPSIFVLKIGGGSGNDTTSTRANTVGGGGSSTGTSSSSSSSSSSSGGSGGGRGSHTGGSSAGGSGTGGSSSSSSSTDNGGTVSAHSDTSGSASQGAGGGFSVSLALAPQPSADSSGDDAKKASTTPKQMVVSTCALKVLATAVNVCVYKTLNKNVLDKLENFGLYQVLAVAGTAATIASLSHSSGGDTAWITGGAAVATAVAANSEKALPSPTSAQIPSIVNAGLDYLLLDSPMDSVDIKASYANLFNASIAQCPLNGT